MIASEIQEIVATRLPRRRGLKFDAHELRIVVAVRFATIATGHEDALPT